jgi:hypothetical protein
MSCVKTLLTFVILLFTAENAMAGYYCRLKTNRTPGALDGAFASICDSIKNKDDCIAGKAPDGFTHAVNACEWTWSLFSEDKSRDSAPAVPVNYEAPTNDGSESSS